MARSKRSALYVLTDGVSMLPWWIGCVLALVAYVILHLLAGIAIDKPTNMAQMGNFAVKQILLTVALFGQYVLPFVFLLGALLSFLSGGKRKALYEDAQGKAHSRALLDMSWQEFEMLVEESFRRQGYSTARTGGNVPDGGVDIVLRKDNEIHLVQCKQWKSFSLGVQPVRELYGVMAARHAAGGFVVCAGKFTAEAQSFAENINITLIDGAQLHRMIREARAQEPSVAQQSGAPACPECGKKMVKRVAKKGTRAGTEFWGCPGYPRCLGVR